MSEIDRASLERRQDAINALLGVLNDIGGGQRENHNVSYEAAAKALDATGLLEVEVRSQSLPAASQSEVSRRAGR